MAAHETEIDVQNLKFASLFRPVIDLSQAPGIYTVHWVVGDGAIAYGFLLLSI